jgi:hypothetical protein
MQNLFTALWVGFGLMFIFVLWCTGVPWVMTTQPIQPFSIDTIPLPPDKSDFLSQEQQALLYFTVPTCNVKQ